jgi:hypothetical protein
VSEYQVEGGEAQDEARGVVMVEVEELARSCWLVLGYAALVVLCLLKFGV